jgi:antitoxin FitA
MANLTIRNIDEHVKARLRVNAALKGVSMEEEVRQVLTRATMTAANDPAGPSLFTRIRARMQAVGVTGVDLDIAAREPARDPPTFAAPASTTTTRRSAKPRAKA